MDYLDQEYFEIDDEEIVTAEQEDQELQRLQTMQADKEKRLMNEFMVRYQALVNEYGFHIVGEPAFVMNHSGSFDITVNLLVGRVR